MNMVPAHADENADEACLACSQRVVAQGEGGKRSERAPNRDCCRILFERHHEHHHDDDGRPQHEWRVAQRLNRRKAYHAADHRAPDPLDCAAQRHRPRRPDDRERRPDRPVRMRQMESKSHGPRRSPSREPRRLCSGSLIPGSDVLAPRPPVSLPATARDRSIPRRPTARREQREELR